MKLKFKMIAVAAAMASLAGGAQADLASTTTDNPSLALVAFNTVTRNYYIRDTGFLMNDFLPSGVTTLSGDGGVTGNKTPEAGLLLNASNTVNFGDASFSTWLTGQSIADVRWMVSAADSTGSGLSTATDRHRMITSSADPAQLGSNGMVLNYVGSGQAGGLPGFAGPMGLSVSSPDGAPDIFFNNFLFGEAGLASLDQSVGLYYYARNSGTSASPADTYRYGNSAGFATVTLAANGDFTYSLAAADVAAVPVPAAAWLLGSGLMGLGGFVRRRKAAVALA